MEVRVIHESEVQEWVRAMGTGFLDAHVNEGEAPFRRPGMDLDRSRAAFDGDAIVATLRSFPTELTVPGGRLLAASALTNVAVTATHRRQGLMTRMITPDLRESRERGEAVSILIAAEWPIYGRFGYAPCTEHALWEAQTSRAALVLAAEGRVELIDLRALRQVGPAVYERYRRGQPGSIARTERWWDVAAGILTRPWDPPKPQFVAISVDDAGQPQGYVRYHVEDKWEGRVPVGTLFVDELVAATAAATARLWRYCLEVDWVARVRAQDRPVDEVLPWLLKDGRAARQLERSDFMWLRALDVRAALEKRAYSMPGRLVIDVVDALGMSSGRYALEADDDSATCTSTSESADLTMPVSTLGAVYLGGASLPVLAEADLVEEERPGALRRAQRMFRSDVTPHCNTWF
jgi:predicted acetyltransferase